MSVGERVRDRGRDLRGLRQSFDGGGDFSDGEGANYDGLCFSESCVPEGRWEYLVEEGGAECLSFVVHVSAASVDDCDAAGGGCTLSSGSTSSPAIFFVVDIQTVNAECPDVTPESDVAEASLLDVSDVAGKVVTGPHGGGCSFSEEPPVAAGLLVVLVLAALRCVRRRSVRA